MCRILLSIKPEFVRCIIDGSKKYEFRKTRCKRDVKRIVIYSSSPEMKVVAEADVSEILVDTPEEIWKITSDHSGISKEFFDEYYQGRDCAVAYHLDNVNVFEEPRSLSDFGIAAPPQSFAYIDDYRN